MEGKALARVDASLLEQAFSQAAADSGGTREAVIRLAALTGTDQYALELPAAALSSGGTDRRIRVEIPGVELTLPGNMLKGQSFGEEEWISLSIARAAPEKIDPQWAAIVGNRPVLTFSIQTGDAVLSWHNNEASVTVAVDYEPSAEEQMALEYLGVYYLSDEGQAVPIASGRYDEAGKRIIFRTSHFSTFAIVLANKRNFPDLGGYLWAQEAAEVLAAKGLVEGGTDGRFEPGAALTRADLALLLTRLVPLAAANPPSAAEPFADVSPAAYYYQAVAQARAAGWIEGREDNRFAPDESISRQEMMALLYRALGQSLKVDAPSAPADGKLLSAFEDSAQVADYAVEAAAAFISAGLVEGDGTLLRPADPLTRAQAAVLLHQIYRQL